MLSIILTSLVYCCYHHSCCFRLCISSIFILFLVNQLFLCCFLFCLSICLFIHLFICQYICHKLSAFLYMSVYLVPTSICISDELFHSLSLSIILPFPPRSLSLFFIFFYFDILLFFHILFSFSYLPFFYSLSLQVIDIELYKFILSNYSFHYTSCFQFILSL